ncbi:unnamed protein product [Linum tenue]|uniref:Uncharacterized protein n=1 Tax=Linum tenue TaxID=586396 RepID=A0AAV0NF68_9ROSI|nr:unnamed protein product [Linum tenue]
MDEFDGAGWEGDGIGLRDEELRGEVVVGSGLGGVDLEVLLESGDDLGG